MTSIMSTISNIILTVTLVPNNISWHSMIIDNSFAAQTKPPQAELASSFSPLFQATMTSNIFKNLISPIATSWLRPFGAINQSISMSSMPLPARTANRPPPANKVQHDGHSLKRKQTMPHYAALVNRYLKTPFVDICSLPWRPTLQTPVYSETSTKMKTKMMRKTLLTPTREAGIHTEVPTTRPNFSIAFPENSLTMLSIWYWVTSISPLNLFLTPQIRETNTSGLVKHVTTGYPP